MATQMLKARLTAMSLATLHLALCFLLLSAGASAAPAAADDGDDGATLIPLFASEVDRRLDLPADEQKRYADILQGMLETRKIADPQYVILVDRSELVQALMIYWLSPQRTLQYIGASPVSTGRPGRFDHSITPVGIFEHTTDNPDFRAEGTKNENGIRGYGLKGMRVYDFGWQKTIKGWGYKDEFQIRFQMHATDPLLERRVGTWQSKGCVRIPSSLNAFIDRHAILDGDYERSIAAKGTVFWVLPKDRQPTQWPGRFMIVIDTARTERPDWSPDPFPKKPAPKTVSKAAPAPATLPGSRTHAPDAPENHTAGHNTPRPAIP
jgi:hypothetical protein